MAYKAGDLNMFFATKDSRDIAHSTFEKDETEKYYNQILNYCRYHLGFNLEAAEECTQEVFAIYFIKSKAVVIYNPKAWLYRTADNYINRYKRALEKESHKIMSLSNSDIEERYLFYEQDFDSSTENYINIENSIEEILSNLNSEERKLYKLHYKDNLSLKELSLTYGISIPATKSKLHRLKLHIINIVNSLFKNDKSPM
jgi:RNA polymerase sigma factor (sigma-70 family)